MLSAASPPFSSSSVPASPLLREVRLLYRRVCVLRCAGRLAEADALSCGPLTSAIATARASEELPEVKLREIFAAEEERVESAHLLAEILLPMLSAANNATVMPRNFLSPGVAASSSRFATDGNVSNASSPDGDPTRLPSGNTGPMLPGIADFIDEMLTQERPPADPARARQSA